MMLAVGRAGAALDWLCDPTQTKAMNENLLDSVELSPKLREKQPDFDCDRETWLEKLDWNQK